MYRQGDVLLVPVPAALGWEDPVTNGRAVLALGEATGHAHVLEAPGVRLTIGVRGRFVVVPPGGASLVHEEHGRIAIPEGAYRVVIQREYDPRGDRDVLD